MNYIKKNKNFFIERKTHEENIDVNFIKYEFYYIFKNL